MEMERKTVVYDSAYVRSRPERGRRKRACARGEISLSRCNDAREIWRVRVGEGSRGGVKFRLDGN